jgi:hypothetical protein
MEHDAFRSGNFDTVCQKYYNAASLQKEMEAEIAALIALQRYFEEKIVRLPN